MPRSKRPLSDRFREFFNPGTADECWNWLGRSAAFKTANYRLGEITGDDGKIKRAHRVAWELANGPIPAGMSVCHKCDNPLCVNPDHLFIGTKSDNTRDMIAKGRKAPEPIFRGIEHGRAKLTESDVRAIRIVTERYSDIAAAYGISKAHVHRIRTRKLWQHLGD